jgi:simple sugar transport system substrate-binding protein
MIPFLARVLAAFAVLLSLGGGVAHAQDALRFIMVTHGAATDPFWSTIKAGADQAAADTGVELVYRAPEEFDLEAMASLVTAAVAEKPAGLIVSIPNSDALAPPIRAAIDAGIPVISINSGFDVGPALGTLLHVGQSEYEAGRVAGDAMRKAGGSKALCLNHELGNVALDLRCKGFIDGFSGSVEVMAVVTDPDEVKTAVAERLEADAEIDVILALNATIAGAPAVEAAKALSDRTVRVASFDVTDSMLNAVADGAASFVIDQQPFLQGYLPVQYLAVLAREGVVPVSNVSTGPRLIEESDAKKRLGRPVAADDSGATPPAEAEQSGG